MEVHTDISKTQAIQAFLKLHDGILRSLGLSPADRPPFKEEDWEMIVSKASPHSLCALTYTDK